ncbi:hypothetical protein GL50803_0011321 [Giardia duodenalis]|uniref:Uncharacterized protein n=1 Tax=Giardia intestinalis (strain ATCC 50803 / WB clone C6) TaxID=184922 RepID=A8B8J4_GIAIC|nr:hypothetical protein GL50803_0011321 [Giardia intestinalis]KAE8302442.1 hypothetical protein GL50803_0011321 [Giardia intestinalis]|eukprot:XP_001708624.1 Hypothetical protein GL50803_11321 [Giardia lamblia ATCC 50803]
MSITTTFGVHSGTAQSIYYLGGEVAAYLSGFHIVFQNITDGSTVKVLPLGEGVKNIVCFVFSESRDKLIVSEERRDGTSVAFYELKGQLNYVFKHRMVVSDKPGASLFYADLLTDTRLLVITGSPDYAFCIFDNESKSATPSFSLTICHENLFSDSAVGVGGGGNQMAQMRIFSKIKVLKLSDKDLVICSGPVLRCIKLGDSSAKILPPSGLSLLPGKRTFTDLNYINIHLKKRFPLLPLDTDRLIFISTSEGTILIMYNNTVISEFKCRAFKDISISNIALIFPGGNGPNGLRSAESATGSSVTTGTMNSVRIFDRIAEEVKQEERSVCYLATFCYGGILNIYGVLMSPICNFITSVVYGNSAKIEGKLNLEHVFKHLLSYSAGAIIDHILSRVSPPFHFHSVHLTTNERSVLCLGGSDMFKIIFAVNMQAITKRIDELDRQRACQVAQKADKSGTVAAVAAVGAGEDKKTLTTDSTRLLGEIVDYNEMAINFDAVGVLNHNEHLELHNFLLDPYASTNQELYLLKPVMTNGNIFAMATCPSSDNLIIVTTDRIVRLFHASTLVEKSYSKFNEVLGVCAIHPSGNYVAIASSEYVLFCVIYYDRVEKIHQFPIPFCKSLCFTNAGNLLVAGSGSYLYVYDVYTRAEVAKATDFSGRIVSISPVTRDFTSMRYSSDVIITCSDGAVCRYNLTTLTKESATAIRSVHFIHAAPISAAHYLSSSIHASATQGIVSTISRSAAVASPNSSALLPETPVFFAITSDGNIIVISSNMAECPKYSSYLNTNNGSTITGATGIQYTKGRALCLINVMNYIVVGYEFGCVAIRSITNIMNGEAPGEGSKEIVIPVSSGSITSLVPNPSNNGFIVGTMDGVVYSVLINKTMPPRTIVLSKGNTGSKISIGLGGISGEESLQMVPKHMPIYVKRTALMDVLTRITKTRDNISIAKRKLEEKVTYLETEFSRTLNQIRQKTSENISSYLSEYSRIEAEHDGKAILLKRQITSNENLFKNSLEALQEQYQRRLVLINDNLAVLAGQKLSFDKEIEEKIAAFKQETEQMVADLKNAKEADLSKLKRIMESIENDIESQRKADEMLFNLSENELYHESDQLTAVYERKIQKAYNNYADVERYNAEVKERYSELESQLLDQKRFLLAKEKEIADLKAFISSQRKDMGNIRLEISSRDDTISNRERRVFELRKQIRELVKVRFVLDYKIREYSRQVEPRDVQLASLKVRLNEMNTELQNYRTSLLQLKSTQKDLERRNLTLKKQITDVQESSAATNKRMEEMRPFINELGLIAYEDAENKPPVLAALFSGSADISSGSHGGLNAIVMGKPQESGSSTVSEEAESATTLPRIGTSASNRKSARSIRSYPSGHSAKSLPSGVSGRTPSSALKPPKSGEGNYYTRSIAVPGENLTYKRLVKAIKYAYMALTFKPNAYTEEKDKKREEGNFSHLEKTICNLERKLANTKTTKKSSTSTVVQQNAMLLQEINHLRRELHVAQVNSNAESKIDPRLLQEYESRKQEILKLRALIRKLEAGSVTGGAFLPDVETY